MLELLYNYMLTFDYIFSKVYVSEDVKTRAIDMYSNVPLNGDNVKAAIIILSSLIESEPIHIDEFSEISNISKDKVQYKMNVIAGSYI